MFRICISYNPNCPEFDTYKKHEDFARILSGMMNNHKKSSCPYSFDNDDLIWYLDDGNDWKVKFIDDSKVELTHRYHNEKALRALADWVAYRTNGEVEVFL